MNIQKETQRYEAIEHVKNSMELLILDGKEHELSADAQQRMEAYIPAWPDTPPLREP